jgi:hypothetical protein
MQYGATSVRGTVCVPVVFIGLFAVSIERRAKPFKDSNGDVEADPGGLHCCKATGGISKCMLVGRLVGRQSHGEADGENASAAERFAPALAAAESMAMGA